MSLGPGMAAMVLEGVAQVSHCLVLALCVMCEVLAAMSMAA